MIHVYLSIGIVYNTKFNPVIYISNQIYVHVYIYELRF